jgi:hypothetical protein
MAVRIFGVNVASYNGEYLCSMSSMTRNAHASPGSVESVPLHDVSADLQYFLLYHGPFCSVHHFVTKCTI